MNFSLIFIKLYSTMNSLHNPVKINEFLANQKIRFSYLLGLSGLEPPTSRLSGARSNHLSYEPVFPWLTLRFFTCSLGGDDGIRTHDPLLAGQVLSQLSYTPGCILKFLAILQNRTTNLSTRSISPGFFLSDNYAQADSSASTVSIERR